MSVGLALWKEGEGMLLTMREQRKIEVIQGVMDKRITVEEGGRVLGRSVRTIFRMLKRLRENGLKGLFHGSRGRRSPLRLSEKVRQRIVTLAKGDYADINDTHLREILEKRERIVLSREKLRQILRAEKLPPKQKRKTRPYRSRRERKENSGMMLQLDASPHDWLEGRGPYLTLVGAIDDATNHVWAHFEGSETTWAYFNLMEDVFLSKGLPLSLYSDRHSIFHVLKEPTIIEQLNNQRPLTQFGRAMEDLGIRIIKAWSPQAKGRIERLWRTFQDRLIVEMRLAGIKTKEGANLFLKQFLPESNHRFSVPAKKTGSFFRKSPAVSTLDRILCLKETRVVNKDHTVSFDGLVLQIPPSTRWRSITGHKVHILQLKNGSVEIIYKNRMVARFSPEAISKMVTLHKTERNQLKYAA